MFQNLDGKTKGPTCFSGKIGKQLTYCENLTVVNIKTIDSEGIIVMNTNLIKDQQYILDVNRSVMTRECVPELAMKDPGPLNHSRFLTCANRVLRLYISEINPCET